MFVGGLPENGTEDIIVEIFEQCGEIIALRKSKKHFCHIRFGEEYMVDKAIYLSGRYCLTLLYTVMPAIMLEQGPPESIFRPLYVCMFGHIDVCHPP